MVKKEEPPYRPVDMPICEKGKINCNRSKLCWKRNKIVCSILNDTHFENECPFYKKR